MTGILGIPLLRIEIIRNLLEHPEGATTGEIARLIGTRYQTIRTHIEELERLGAVERNVGRPKTGRGDVYTMSREALDRALEDLDRYLGTRGTPRNRSGL